MNKKSFLGSGCHSAAPRLISTPTLLGNIAKQKKHMNLSGKIKGLEREEHLEIPVDALREALINCLCHRQYDYYNETPSLAIYDDRVEITNPGHFPAGVTPENIKKLHVSKPRNLTIAQVLYKAKRLENWGSGIQRMIDACNEQGLPEPEYNVWADGTIVIIFRKKTLLENKNKEDNGHNCETNRSEGVTHDNEGVTHDNEGVNTIEKSLNTLLEIIELAPGKRANELSNRMGKSIQTIERYIKLLKKRGLIEYRGAPKNGGYYVLPGQKNNN